MTTTAPTVANDLRSLLHPADERDIPVPGFPSGAALEAWAKTKPRREVVRALKGVLRSGSFPQQYAAMSALRSLGVAISGHWQDGRLRWETTDGKARDLGTIKPGADFDGPSDRTGPSTALHLIIVCDLDSNRVPAIDSLMFGYDGKEYRLNLCAKHLLRVQQAFELYVAAGRVVGRSGYKRQLRRTPPESSLSADQSPRRSTSDAKARTQKPSPVDSKNKSLESSARATKTSFPSRRRELVRAT